MGYVLLLSMALGHINRNNWFPVFIGLVGIWHYGAIFSFPGQLVFSYVLLMNTNPLEDSCIEYYE